MITIGILADFDDWRRERKRKEYIDSFRGLYGDNMPDDVIDKLEKKMSEIKSFDEMSGGDFTLPDAQYLLAKVRQSERPELTFDEAVASIPVEGIEDELAKLFPPAAPKKKRSRHPVKKRL